MRHWRSIGPVIATVVLCGCGQLSNQAATPTGDVDWAGSATATTPWPADPWSTVTPTPVPVPTATPVTPEAVEAALRACISSSDMEGEVAAVASRVRNCVTGGGIAVETLGIAGDVPAIIVERGYSCVYGDVVDVIAWQRAGTWRSQLLESPFLKEEFVRLVRHSAAVPGSIAREETIGNQRYVADIAEVYSCGSAPRQLPILLAFDGSGWRVDWTPQSTAMMDLSDTRSTFAGSGIGEIEVQGEAWPRLPEEPDLLGELFFESHPGPHRWFRESWTLKSHEYTMADKSETPSPYATLVHFMYALALNDDVGATKQLADPSLLATAKTLGLVQQPAGQQWMADDYTSFAAHQIHILSGPQWKSGPPQPVVVTFVERDSGWLISAIAAE